jgi:hypothetical protein
MRYPDDKNSKEEEDHWIGLSDFERERFERHAERLYGCRSAHLVGQDRLEDGSRARLAMD